MHPWGLGAWESAFSKSPGGFGAAGCHSEPLTPGEVQRVEYYFAEGSGGRSQSAAIIYQQNPINMICQTGPNGHIAIENAKAVQIGYGNVMKREAEDSDIAIRNSTAVQIGYRNVMAMTEENGESADRHQEQTLRGQGRGAFDPLRSRVLSGHQGPPRWPSRERGQLPLCPDQSCPAFPHILTPFASFSVGPDTFP